MSFAHGERHLAISSAIMMGKSHDNLFGHICIYRRAIGFNLFGGNESNDFANPAGNEEENKSDNPSADEHQEEDSDHHSGGSEENEYESDGDEDA
jgi:hypothetical protein